MPERLFPDRTMQKLKKYVKPRKVDAEDEQALYEYGSMEGFVRISLDHDTLEEFAVLTKMGREHLDKPI